MIVVDTNVISYLYLESARAGQADAALLRDPDWVAPALWRSELCNVLAQYMLREVLDLSGAQRIMEEAEDLMAGREYSVSSREVLELAQSSGCTAYDCEFVALAKDLGVPLVTVDRDLLDSFPGIAVDLLAFANNR